MKRLALVVEADADARTATAYADRVFSEAGLDPEVTREWEKQITWRDAAKRRHELGRKAHGHFNGEAGAPDAQAARGVLMVLDLQSPRPDAVILMRDADLQDQGRRRGLEQARQEHELRGHSPTVVVIGLAVPKREAWVLVGFDPLNDEEREALASEQRRLGFDPTRRPHRLAASKHGAEHDIKVCVKALAIDPAREADCYSSRSTAELHERGEEIGLSKYLNEVRDRISPLLTRV